MGDSSVVGHIIAKAKFGTSLASYILYPVHNMHIEHSGTYQVFFYRRGGMYCVRLMFNAKSTTPQVEVLEPHWLGAVFGTSRVNHRSRVLRKKVVSDRFPRDELLYCCTACMYAIQGPVIHVLYIRRSIMLIFW